LNWAQAASLRQRGAGTKKGEPLSPEAQKAYDEMLKSKNKRKKDCKK